MNEIDKYIQSFPDEIQEILYKIRGMVKELAPGAEEKMAYGMPGYKTNKRPLIYFAAYKNHIGCMLHLKHMMNLKRNYLDINKAKDLSISS
ncbi:MAG: iron chaperone [Fermentimonas caenicola]